MLIDEKLDKLYDKREAVKLKALQQHKQEIELLIEEKEILKKLGYGYNNGREKSKSSRVKEEEVRESHRIPSSRT